jgi:hypothetical protein
MYWTYSADGCVLPDLAQPPPPDMAVGCTCNGNGPGGTPITVSCGQSACGSDNNTWTCVDSGSYGGYWIYGGDGCS